MVEETELKRGTKMREESWSTTKNKERKRGVGRDGHRRDGDRGKGRPPLREETSTKWK